METNQRFELYLNHISMSEYGNHKDHYEEYQKKVVTTLCCHNKYVFEDELIQKLSEDVTVQCTTDGEPLTMEHIKATFPAAYISVGKKKKNKEDKNFIMAWCNVWDENFYIQPHHLNYEIFFCYKLRSLSLFDIDSFLDYQMAMHYGNDPKKIARFLQLTLRKYSEKILEPSYIQTINEWIVEKERQSIHADAEPGETTLHTKINNKHKQRDNVSKLSQEQTALLIYFLQRAGIIRGEQSLNNTEAGGAFEILTGYSAHTLRQSLNKEELKKIASRKNLKAVSDALTQANNLLDAAIKTKKDSAEPS